MGRLAVFLTSFFTSVFAWFSGFMGSKLALAGTVVVVSLASMTALFLLFKTMVGWLIIPAMVNEAYEPFVMSFFAVWPSNAETCLSVIFGSDIAVFLYRYKVRLIGLVS